jgi:protein-disulfide isomerase
MREIWFALIGALTLLGGLPAAAQSPALPNEGTVLTVAKDDRILGKPNAPITIIEYASMTCPHCAHFENDVLPQLKKEWIDTGKAKLILRDFPLDKLALRAAMIARCAPPGQFYAFVDTFFATQEQWVMASDYKAALLRLAKLGGMSPQQFDKCLADKALEDKIIESRLVADKVLGVDATPTFFVNGKKFPGAPTVEEFDKLLSGLASKS